jgi:thiamine biosynthesis lipoprotein
VLVADTSDPEETDHTGEVITLYGGGLATSGIRARRWSRGGQVVHHLVDPRTGLPTGGPWQTASVLADTCLLANVASTAAIVSGKDAVRWLTERSFSARLVAGDGTVVHVGDWPREMTT